VSSTGAAQNKTLPSIDLNSTTPAIPAAVATGTIGGLSLSAVVDAAQGAAAGLNSTLSNVTAVGGLLSVPNATSNLGANAKPADADGLRGAKIDSIQVLNLGAVLQGLGVNPANLQLGQVGNALSALNLTVPNGSTPLSGAQLITTVNGITGMLNTPLPNGIQGVPAITPLSDPTLASLLGPIAALFPGGTIPAGVTNVGGLVTALNGQVTSLLTGALSGLSTAPLLQLNNLVVGLSTKAADTVANSAATIQASIGSVKIGNLAALPGVDLASTAQQVTTLVNDTQTKVNGVLGTLGLGNLVTVKVLDQVKSVSADKGYVNALANITGLHVAIAPLGLAGGTAQAATDTMGQLLGAANVPALSGAMASLNSLLPTSVTGALTQGAEVNVLTLGTSSAFVPSSTPVNPAAPTPANGTLAVTGGPTQALGLIGLLLLAVVAGLRWLRRPVTTN
jgi:hypothetical protein